MLVKSEYFQLLQKEKQFVLSLFSPAISPKEKQKDVK